MPLYEYRCKACGQTTEALQRMADAPLTDCPACAASALEKLMSAHNVGAGGPGGGASPAAMGPPPGCGRCGDPQGPCGLS